jgi:TolA-binding protein
MSPIETQDELSEDTTGASEGDSTKLVPVTESIRYRKRAQSAEKKIEVLTEQLAEANEKAAQMSEQLSSIQTEQEMMRKLAAEHTADLEAAVLIVKARTQGKDDADLDGLIEQLKKEKPYLFGGTSGVATATKTAGARGRISGNERIIEKAAKQAATTGNRTDLQEYLKLRRDYL